MKLTLLWAFAFLGVVILYTWKPILRLFGIKQPGEPAIIVVKAVGLLVSAAALLILYLSGGLT